MKTKKTAIKCFIILLVLLYSNQAFSQVIPSTSGYIPSSQEYWDSIPLFVRSPQSNLIDLPSVVDNSTKLYFPQVDNTSDLYMYYQRPTPACQSASTAWYTFAYEINRLRGLQANTQETRYAPNFSYNHLAHGHQGWLGYTSLETVQTFLMESGAMSDAEFDGPEQLDPKDSWRWPTGYDKYYHVLTNKLDYVRRFNMGIPYEQNGDSAIIARLVDTLNDMKHYLAHHNEGSEDGGVITIGVISLGPQHRLVPPSPHATEWVIHNFQYEYGGHAMTIVGYNDSICFDWGGTGTLGNPLPDGQFRNDIDNNKDGIIDMRDWEIGAFKVANSYGYEQNDGFIWIMYSFLPYLVNEWHWHEFYALHPKCHNTPEVVLKVKLDADKREDLSIGCGFAPLANFQNFSGNPKYYTGYTNDGGNLPIQGKDKDENFIFGPIEVLFDYNHFYSETDYGKVFLVIRQDSSSSAELNSYSLVDYRWNEEFELPHDGENITINPGTQSFGIEYHLIPHEDEITEDITFEANRVSRFNPTLANNATMTILDDVRIDMYNSQLTINYGSMLDIGNNVVFLAKRGNNNITIKGDAVFGQNVSFITEEGALLTVSFENPEGNAGLELAYFENVSIFVSCQKLELKNSLVLHGPSNKTFVNRGGRLVIDNTTFSNSSALPWRGIEVWGNSSLGHIPPTNQGWVQIINGGVIENAICGVRTSKAFSSAGQEEDVYGYSGGIVQASGAIFRNNRNAVEFLPYHNANNLGFFRECQFITDAELIDAELPDYFLRFNGVQNIKVQGCSFSNTRTFQESELKERGNGIFASNSDIILENYCTGQAVPCPPQDIVNSEFSNLYYAVYGIGTGQNRTVKIKDVDFNENIRSVYLSALDFAEITLSRFNTWPETGQYQEPQSYGLYLDACTGYTVEENTFAGTALPVRAGLGLVINDSGPDANMVYNNVFNDLLYASIAQNSNRHNSNPELGLCYKCNEFSNNDYDILISTEYPQLRNQGIAAHQGADIKGDNTAPAGNIFTIPSNVFDISNGAGPVIYFMHETHNGFNLTPDPVSAGVTVSTVRNTAFSREVSCPSNLGGSGPPAEEEKMMAAGLQADSVYTELAILVDGGSTDALATTVITTTEPEVPQTQSELLQNSPYLSDSILQTTITREDVFTNPMIYDVMVANPQSGKSEVILDMLEGKTEPMPSYLMADIYDGRLTVSDKEALEAMAGHWIREGFKAYTNLFRMYSSDSIVENLTGLLSAAGFLQARYKLAMFYLGNQQYVAANQVLAALPLEFDLDASQAVVHQKYLDLSSLWQSIAGDSVYFTNPGSSLITDIETLFGENSCIPSVYARNLLVSAKMLQHNEKIILSQELKKARWYDRSKPTEISGSRALKVYPNPAGTQLWVSIPEDCLLANAIIEVLNSEGRKTSSIKPDNHLFMIDSSKWPAGLYLLKLWDGKQWLGEKVLVE
jgi:hypothetical protein